MRLSSLTFSDNVFIPQPPSSSRLVVPIKRANAITRQIDDDSLEEFPKGLEGVYKAFNVESYLRIAVNKHISLSHKNGWNIVGTDDKAVDYIKRRLFEIEQVSNIPTNDLIRSIIRNLVMYSNAILTKVRAQESSSGKPKTVNGKRLEPIAAYYSQNPRGISIERNKSGKVVAWRQGPSSEGASEDNKIRSIVNSILGTGKNFRNEKIAIFPNENIVHFFYNREDGYVFGEPIWTTVLPDILALRRLEEDAEQLVHNHAFPLTLYKIGNDQYPAQADEILDRKTTIEAMDSGEILVGTHREEIETADYGQQVGATPYLEYFEQRVLSGLNISGIELGRSGTSNRGTATEIIRQRVEQCKDFQTIVQNYFRTFIILELLDEGGFDLKEIGSDSSSISLKFKEIDIDEMIKWQNHVADLYAKDQITLDEARAMMDMDPEIDETRMRIELVTKKEFQYQAEFAPKPTDSVNRPANQYGRKTNNRSTKNDSLAEDLEKKYNLNTMVDDLSGEFISAVDSVLENYLNNPQFSNGVILYSLLKLSFIESADKYIKQMSPPHVANIVFDRFYRFSDKLWGDGAKILRTRYEDEKAVIKAFDKIKSSSPRASRFTLRKAMNMSEALKGNCVSRKTTLAESPCSRIDGSFIISGRYDDVPPWHSNCSCLVEKLVEQDGDNIIFNRSNQHIIIDDYIDYSSMATAWLSDFSVVLPYKVFSLEETLSVTREKIMELAVVRKNEK